jgi:RNA polymerase sigma factor (sigma-70 family)
MPNYEQWREDHTAFETWFREHYSDVARFCARRCDDPADAEDATTETFAVAWRRRGRLPPGHEALPWLFGIARRVLANQQRARARRARLIERLRGTVQPVLPPPEQAGEFAAVVAALQQLPPHQRELLVLTAWDGLSVAELAKVLGVPGPVVSRRLHRARRRLAGALDAPAPAPTSLPTTLRKAVQ